MAEEASCTPRRVATCGFDSYIRSFVNSLHAARYAPKSIREKRRIVASFVAWLHSKDVGVHAVDESHTTAFLKRLAKRSKDHRARVRAALLGFLRHLRDVTDLAPCQAERLASQQATIAQRYADYLRNERGLTERSIQSYLPYVGSFLESHAAPTDAFNPGLLDAQVVRSFLLEHTRGRSTAYAKLPATSLRSLLRFLFLRGETFLDLSIAVPTVRRWSQVPVHAFLAPEAVERVLSIPDRTTPSGRRDYAILMLLARLGLRAGEVVTLELNDIHWRTGEIVLRGKGRYVDRLPLVSDVGEALSDYLQEGRGPSRSRRVFLRKVAPRIGLTGPSAVGCVVREAVNLAGVPRARGCAAHIFRHSLATRMIRHGASISEISKVLRHRCAATTEIYAKVDFETLRGVGRAWPGADEEGAR